MSRYPKADLSSVRLTSIEDRSSKVHDNEWAIPYEPSVDFEDFLDSLPDILVARSLRRFVGQCVQAVQKNKPFILMMGGHVIKVGLAPLICDMLEKGILTGVVMNSAAAIHDVESALFGETSEDVAAAITDGSFGMAKETGEFINNAIAYAYQSDNQEIGFGEAVGERLLAREIKRPSVIASCLRLGKPITVHVAIGADIVHQQPTMSGEGTGELSFRDFRLLCEELKEIGSGGVVMNLGSAVILPEVFLKALTVARNLGAQAFDFTTANFDMLQHYRPRVNVTGRPVQDGGEGFAFTGHHEIMFPLFAAALKSELRKRGR